MKQQFWVARKKRKAKPIPPHGWFFRRDKQGELDFRKPPITGQGCDMSSAGGVAHFRHSRWLGCELPAVPILPEAITGAQVWAFPGWMWQIKVHLNSIIIFYLIMFFCWWGKQENARLPRSHSPAIQIGLVPGSLLMQIQRAYCMLTQIISANGLCISSL